MRLCDGVGGSVGSSGGEEDLTDLHFDEEVDLIRDILTTRQLNVLLRGRLPGGISSAEQRTQASCCCECPLCFACTHSPFHRMLFVFWRWMFRNHLFHTGGARS